MEKIQLVVFDIAGTTVHDEGDVAATFVNAFKKYSLEVDQNAVNEVMGFRKRDAISSLLKKFYPDDKNHSEELIDKIHDSFISNMVSFYKTDPGLRPLPHAEQTFKTLHDAGLKLALNTGFTKEITDTILQRLGWKNNLVDLVISSDEVAQGRPHPFMIKALMKSAGIEDARLVAKVGDTQVDVQEGRNAGCGLVISVTTGAYSREQFQNFHPDFIIDSLNELPALIK